MAQKPWTPDQARKATEIMKQMNDAEAKRKRDEWLKRVICYQQGEGQREAA